MIFNGREHILQPMIASCYYISVVHKVYNDDRELSKRGQTMFNCLFKKARKRIIFSYYNSKFFFKVPKKITST